MATAEKPSIEELKVMLRPLADRVLILPDEATDVTPGGIHIPKSAEEVPQEGVVLRVGPGKRNGDRIANIDDPGDAPFVPRYDGLDVKEGNRVYYSKYAGVEITLGESVLKLLREDDILAVMGE